MAYRSTRSTRDDVDPSLRRAASKRECLRPEQAVELRVLRPEPDVGVLSDVRLGVRLRRLELAGRVGR